MSSWLNNKMTAGTKDLAYKRLFTLFGMPGKVDTKEMWESIGRYGLGNKRSLEQYQEFIGVNLTTLEVRSFPPTYLFLCLESVCVSVCVCAQTKWSSLSRRMASCMCGRRLSGTCLSLCLSLGLSSHAFRVLVNSV